MTARIASLMALCLALLPLAACGEKDATAAGHEKAKVITHVDPYGAAEVMTGRKGVLLLDIRTPQEFRAGHIRGASNIDFYKRDFSTRIAELDRDQPVLIYCRTGSRTTQTLAMFRQLGFKEVIHLDGGIAAWYRAGMPITG